jgi:2-dehydropantoate 2-reductase
VERGLHFDAMRSGGLQVESPAGDFHLTEVTVTGEPSSVGVVDIVIFAVKLWDAERAAEPD